MMNNSYQSVWEDRQGEWMLQWTQSVNDLWLSVPEKKRQEQLRWLYDESGRNVDEEDDGMHNTPWDAKDEIKEIQESLDNFKKETASKLEEILNKISNEP